MIQPLDPLNLVSPKATEAGFAQLLSNSPTLEIAEHWPGKNGYIHSLSREGFAQERNGAMRIELDAMLDKPPPAFVVEEDKSIPAGFLPNLADLKGEVVLIDFWRANTGIHINGDVKLKAVYEKYKKRGLKIVGVHASRDLRLIDDFARLNAIPWPIVVDNGGVTGTTWNAGNQQGIFLLDRKGNVRFSRILLLDLEKAIELLLGEEK